MKRGAGLIYQPKYKDKKTGEVKISRVYWIQWNRNGTTYRESAETTKASEAREKLNEKLADQRPVAPPAKRVTLTSLSQAYLQDYETHGYRSLDTARGRVSHLLDVLGADTRAKEITRGAIQRYQLQRQQAGATSGTINRETSALARMFSIAIDEGMLTWCPPFPGRLKERKPREGFFEHPEYLAVRARLPEAYAAVLDFGYLSGWRLREITGLPWSEVDLPGSVIMLAPERSKSGAARTLYINPLLREVLSRRLSARRLDTPLVFHHHGGRPVGDWRKVWKRACREAGVPGRLFHDLRRTTARNLIASGVPETHAMRMLGHKTRSMFDRCAITSKADEQNASAALGEHLAALGGAGGSLTVVPVKGRRSGRREK
jgi:integrase